MYHTYTQTATKLGKDENNRIIYAIAPTNRGSSDNASEIMEIFTTNLNAMPGKDRLKIKAGVKTLADGDIVIYAEYVTVDDSVKLAKVIIE